MGTGAAFGDYDGDGFLDLMVANYVDVDLHHLPSFGSAMTCRFMGVNVQCGPRGLKGSGDGGDFLPAIRPLAHML